MRKLPQGVQRRSLRSLLDGLIILDEYLSLDEESRLPSGFELFIQRNPELGKSYYRLMDTRNSGAISWSDFAAFYSCKLIVAKNKVSETDPRTFSVPTIDFRRNWR